MSYANGPRIVTDGLIMYLDAANSKSYPGSGTTWYDLSGNGKHGTLINGVTHTSVNGGCFLFDGINDGIDVYTTLDLRYSDYTIMCASRYVSVNTGTTHGGGRIVSAYYNNWLLGHWERSTDKHYAVGWVSNSSGTENNGDLTWKIYTGNRNHSLDQSDFYSNNTKLINNSAGGSGGPYGFGFGRYRLGASGSGTEWSNSLLSFVMAYNRVLSDAEVTQNYNALKGRYGLS